MFPVPRFNGPFLALKLGWKNIVKCCVNDLPLAIMKHFQGAYNQGMGNLSYFLHSVGLRGFVFRGFGFVTSDDLINRTLKTNLKNAP